MCLGLPDRCIENNRLTYHFERFAFIRRENNMKDYINNVLSPLIQGDGGYIEYVSEEENFVTVLARGECSKCAKLDLCLNWCEERIEKDLHRTVKLTAIRKKPFFWDK